MHPSIKKVQMKDKLRRKLHCDSHEVTSQVTPQVTPQVTLNCTPAGQAAIYQAILKSAWTNSFNYNCIATLVKKIYASFAGDHNIKSESLSACLLKAV